MKENEKILDESVAVEQPVDAPAKTKRQSYIESLKGEYPDDDLDDDEVLFDKISSKHSDYDGRLGGYRKHDEEMASMFAKDPLSAKWLLDVKKGVPAIDAFVELYGSDLAEMLAGEEGKAKVSESNKKYAERVSKEESILKQQEENMEASLGVMVEFCKSKGFDEASDKEYFEKLTGVVEDVIMGKYTTEMLEGFYKMFNYDADVKDAEETGLAQGRNENIGKLKTKKDAILPPTLQSKAPEAEKEKPAANATVDFLNKFAKK